MNKTPTEAALRMRKRREANPELEAAKSREWRQNNAERAREHARKARLKRLDKIREYQKNWVAKNKEHLKRKNRERYLRDRERILHTTREKALGLPAGTYAKLLELSGPGCRICGKVPTNKALAVDHDHATGRIRGLICCECNSGIGLLQDDPSVLEKARLYLLDLSFTDRLAAAGLPENVVCP